MSALNVVPDGKHSKNAFDLSNFETFHQKGGIINVVGVRDTVPNSEYRMSVDGFTKTLLCNTANFARIKENYYFVHVPLGLLSRNAYQMLVQRKQSYSALDMDITQFPVFNIENVVKRCVELAVDGEGVAENYTDVHGFNVGFNALRLLDMLGYGCYTDFVDAINQGAIDLNSAKTAIGTALSGLKPSVARIAAYQCVWYNFFRNDIYDNDVDASCYNFDDCHYVSGGDVEYDVTEVRGVDNFITNCLQIRYNPYKKDLFMGAMPGTQFGAVSTVSLMDNVVFDIDGSSVLSGAARFDTDYARVRPAGAAPDENIGIVRAIPPTTATGEYSDLVLSTSLNSDTPVQIRQAHTHSVSLPDADGILTGGTSLFDVLSLVESQAIQKWRQKSMLAGNKTVDQFRAHHGVVPRHLIDHLPDFIGSVDNEIVIKEITSQANTLDVDDGKNNLGEIRGRGYGASDNRTFKFYSDDYGILMLLHTIVPENTYSSYGMDKGNMMVYYSDFFQQEYENIGLETVPKILLNTAARYPFPELVHGQGQEAGFADDFDEGNVGYAPRNYGYKQYPSRVHGMFNPSRLRIRDESGDDHYPDNITDVYGYSDMQSFVLTRSDMIGRYQITLYNPGVNEYSRPYLFMSLSKLYVNPKIFDSIFAIAADSTYQSDVFITHCRFNCQALLPMTVLGLPQF